MTTKAIYDCVVEIHRPDGDYPGQVCEGRYTYEDGVVQLVDHHGVAVKNYSKKINSDENPLIIARRLTRQLYFARRGGKNDFNRPLHYPKLPPWM